MIAHKKKQSACVGSGGAPSKVKVYQKIKKQKRKSTDGHSGNSTQPESNKAAVVHNFEEEKFKGRRNEGVEKDDGVPRMETYWNMKNVKTKISH
jgi:hypothetical protein